MARTEDQEIVGNAQDLGRKIDSALPEDVGFVLVMFRKNSGLCIHVSGARTPDEKRVVREKLRAALDQQSPIVLVSA
jgi:hypothetical protein